MWFFRIVFVPTGWEPLRTNGGSERFLPMFWQGLPLTNKGSCNRWPTWELNCWKSWTRMLVTTRVNLQTYKTKYRRPDQNMPGLCCNASITLCVTHKVSKMSGPKIFFLTKREAHLVNLKWSTILQSHHLKPPGVLGRWRRGIREIRQVQKKGW